MSLFASGVLRRVRQPWRWVPFSWRLRVAVWRGWLIRRQILRRGALLVVMLILGLSVVGVIGRARAVQATWGATHDVVAVRVDVAVGEVVDPADLHLVTRPVSFSAEDVLHQIPSQTDVAARTLRAGEIMTRRDLQSTRPRRVMPTAHLAISIPTGPSVPIVTPGDVVDLYLAPDVFDPAADVAQGLLTSPATVLESQEDSIVLAVHEDDVERVVGAAASGRAIVAVR